jgi:hypothetical protein
MADVALIPLLVVRVTSSQLDVFHVTAGFSYFYFLISYQEESYAAEEVVRSVSHWIDMMSRNVVALTGSSPLIRSFLDLVLGILSFR